MSMESAPDPVDKPPVRAPEDGAVTRRGNATPFHSRVRAMKHSDETDQDLSWFKHKFHVMIFTFSGKPVYTRFGTEDGITSTTAAFSAIVAKMDQFFHSGMGKNKPDNLRYMRAGRSRIVFLEKGPLWCVCISKNGESSRDVIKLLEYVHLQVVLILTTSVERTIEQRPNFDARGLLMGTKPVLSNLTSWCLQDMFLHEDAFEALPLKPDVRHLVTDHLKSKVQGIILGLVLAGHRVVAMAQHKQFKSHPQDICVLVNFIMSSSSLRTAEAWTPVCLPHFHNAAFAYAYVSFFENSDVAVVFLSSMDEADQFYAISQHAHHLKNMLVSTNTLSQIESAILQTPVELKSGLSPDANRDLPENQLALLLDRVIHFAYFVPATSQVFSSAVSPAYRDKARRKMLFRNYGRARAMLAGGPMPCQVCLASDRECYYAWHNSDFHFYLAVPRGISTQVVGQAYTWLKTYESMFFLHVANVVSR
mmetsp:Transcript_12707/g.28452  ORF Transcript_12707/g.28452 Transcript_12707/m.28452 type:complete len:477 (-) Transcript_12707:1-1431(-)